MKIVNIRLANGSSKIKAYFDVETQDGFTMKGFKIAEGSNGLFVGVPSEKGSDGKWYDRIFAPKELKDQLSEIALREFNKVSGNPSAAGSTTPSSQQKEDKYF